MVLAPQKRGTAPNFRPLSIVAKRSPVPATAEPLLVLELDLDIPFSFIFFYVGPIANLKGHYFLPSLSVCVCLWPALLPFNVDRFWWNLVTRTLLWSTLAATIMVQIGRRWTARRLFENFKNSQQSQNSNFKILVHHFLRLCLLCIVNKKASIRWQNSARRQFQAGLRGDVGL